MQIITIIGCGFSGIALALNLLRGDSKLKINLIDKSGSKGFGTIFSGDEKCHLLNEPAINMGAYADEPDHFYKWVLSQDIEAEPYDFLPRALYKNYLQDILDKAILQSTGQVLVQRHYDEAIDITQVDNGALVTLKKGETFFSDKVVLAMGNANSKIPAVQDKSFMVSERYFHNPYSPIDFNHYNNILILGTGTTMADVVSKMYCNSYKGRVMAISPSGMVPFVKEHYITAPGLFSEVAQIKDFDTLFKTVQQLFSNRMNWQYLFDSLRPHASTIWKSFSVRDKKRFLKYMYPIWKKSRYRIPKAYTIAINKLKANDQLEIVAAYLTNITVKAKKLEVEMFLKASSNHTTIDADAVINCLGAETDFRKASSPIIDNLLSQGIIKCDPLYLGLDAKEDGALIDAKGNVSDIFFTIGSPLKGVLGESTDVPEIRLQAVKLAQVLSNKQPETMPYI